MIEWVAGDLRLAIRSLARSRGFAAISVAIFALGLATAALAFSLIHAVLLSPLPWARPDRLFELHSVRTDSSGSLEATRVPVPMLEAVPAGVLGFATSDEARHTNTFYIGAIDVPERVPGALVSANYFEVLDATAVRGRTFRPGEQGDRVAVIAHGLWQRAFGGAASAIGREIRVNGDAYTLIGVMPRAFIAPPPVGSFDRAERIEAWVPAPRERSQSDDYDRVFVRLTPAASVAQVEAALARQADPSRAAPGVVQSARLVPLADVVLGGARRGLSIVAVVVVLAIVIAAANIGAVQIARFAARERDVAIRAALGARGSRLFVHLLSEGVLIAIVGGVLGLLIAIWTQNLLQRVAPAGIPRLEQASISGRVVLFTLGLSLLLGIATTLLPALRVATRANRWALRSAVSVLATPAQRRLREALVALQMVAALALVAGTAVLARSMARLQSIETGVNTANVTAIDLHRRRVGGRPLEAQAFYDELIARVRALPGVSAAAYTSSVPFRPRDYYGQGWRLRIIDGEYIDVLGVRVIAGRTFDSRDHSRTAPVAIVNETLARTRFGGRVAVGERLDDATVVGVIADVRHESLDREPEPALYRPRLQQPDDRLTLLVRSSLAPAALIRTVRQTVQRLDADQPTGRAEPLENVLAQSDAVARRQFQLRILQLIAAFAAVLAGLGVHGVMAQAVAHRSREMGVRMSLGATRRQIGALILRDALRVTLPALALGVALALAFTRTLSSLLFEVSSADPLSLAVAAALLLAGALIAAASPALRAAGVEPIRVLRSD